MREIVLDTETTGFEPSEGHRLVEIGAVELFNHLPTGNTFHQYLNPQRPMPPDAFEVHGLGDDFLRDKPTLMLRVPPAARARREKVVRAAAQSGMAETDRVLFQALRQKRTEMARAQNVPPYVIFHDRTLIELAAARPSSRAEMANVPGVGEAKLDRYGPAFLAVIAEHA